ncbi:MAG: flagellar hook-basal body complex protein [Methylophaga sp.]|nr:flagellar hook-basal body complex protein [Methylophaga sp.]
MSFSTALSGLNAATADLNVKSNNIANVNTIGFKESRAEFGDVFSVSSFGTSSKTAVGSGVVLSNVAQQFNQGNLEFTDNGLDLAISGEGFFAMAPTVSSGEVIYSRAGAFGVNKEGFIVNSAGDFLRTFPVDANGAISATSIAAAQPLQLPASQGEPEATTLLSIATNLPSNAATIDDGAGPPAGVLAIDPFNTATYSNSTSATVFDSLGNEHIVTTYYQKIDTDAEVAGVPVGDNQWQMAVYVSDADIKVTGATTTVTDGATTLVQLGGIARIGFNADGTLNTVDGDTATAGTQPIALDFTVAAGTELFSGAADQTVTMSLTGSSQNSGNFSVGALTVNGFPTGRLTGVDVSDDGLIRATYSNGQAIPIGKIVLARFANPQALNKLGNTTWKETTDSGPVIAGEAGTGSFGQIQSGALETSNVDLTKELVGLITAQRNFQANSKSIETENAITQTIINLR